MIIVKVELHSAITGKVTEIARMGIANVGGSDRICDYKVETYRGRSAEDLRRRIPQRAGVVIGHPRKTSHVWHLVGKALTAMRYIGAGIERQDADLFDAEAQP